jgi:hypothetical protein
MEVADAVGIVLRGPDGVAILLIVVLILTSPFIADLVAR